jgi:hypothetical protein
MNKSSWVFLVLLALLVTCACIAGCSDSSSSSSTSEQTTVTTPAVSSSALYVAGDIIKNPKSTGAAVLIISYDSGSDVYERAYIYPNSDGSWGYRVDATPAKVSRSTIEKVYTEKVSNIAVSAVPIGKPTAAATLAAASATTTTTTTATTATTATTTSTALAPKVTDITPDKGATGTTVSITELDGQNFQSGATVALVKSGESSIAATSVSLTSSSFITCTFVIPSGTTTGFWDILVTNPDGQYYQYKNGFDILEGTTTATTTTTSTTSAVSNVTIVSVTQKIVTGGAADTYTTVDITGTNLAFGANVILTQGSSTITSSTYAAVSNQEAHAFFHIPGASTGTWIVSVVDSSGNVLATYPNGITIAMS